MKDHTINQYWKRIINTMNDGLMLIGPDGAIVMVNQAFERMTGYAREAVIGRPCTLLGCDACEGQLKRADHFWCTLFEKKTEIRCRCTVRRQDGGYLPVLKSAALLEDEDGQPLGAVETFTDISELEALDRRVVELSRQLDTEDGFQGIVGRSPAMANLFEIIRKSAQSEAPVIIYGESGTGKELVARAIHQLSARREAALVMVNCAALNEHLLESELFGHIKGAFTGAYRHRQGRFETAHGGDVFLDEIGDVPLPIQVKLLRFLETKVFERVGDQNPIFVDARIISATHRNLEAMVHRGTFRKDFFFRINVIPVHIPPLRERREDIPLLVNHFIHRLREKTGKPITGLSAAAMHQVMSWDWPGNVRELKSAMEYAFVIAEQGLIDVEALPPKTGAGSPRTATFGVAADPAAQDEKHALIEALRACGGNQTKAAQHLGINRVTVWNRIRKYGIQIRRISASEGEET